MILTNARSNLADVQLTLAIDLATRRKLWSHTEGVVMSAFTILGPHGTLSFAERSYATPIFFNLTHTMCSTNYLLYRYSHDFRYFNNIFTMCWRSFFSSAGVTRRGLFLHSLFNFKILFWRVGKWTIAGSLSWYSGILHSFLILVF